MMKRVDSITMMPILPPQVILAVMGIHGQKANKGNAGVDGVHEVDT